MIKSEKEHSDECNALAERMNAFLDGADLSVCANVLAGMAAHAVAQLHPDDPEHRAESLTKLMRLMWKRAGFDFEDFIVKVNKHAIN